MSHPSVSRREWLAALAASAAISRAQDNPAGGPLKVCVFSKHFQWTDVSEAAALAKQIGFDGIDLTVRKAGHVLPENVSAICRGRSRSSARKG